MTEEDNFLEDCYRKYYTSILNLCRREVNHNPLYADVIDTCIQDTFLLAYRTYAQIKDYTNIRACLPEPVTSIYKASKKASRA